ncbi:MAG TPA: hypothetical protein VFH17_00730, partial [Coriobacteriia bacterium]|nr:hypothetical protein [Coriobacteriia bacterium]
NERELMSSGGYRSVRHEIAVDDSERYRVATIEQDERGRNVVSETVRDGSAVRTSISTQGGQSRVLELRNAPPALGAFADNILGQRVRELARTTGMRLIGTEVIRGRESLTFEVEPGHLVWIDKGSAVVLRERLLADDLVTHEIEVVEFETGGDRASDHSAPSAPAARPESVEDLGYRPATRRSAPTSLLGFAPRPVVPPGSWTLVTSGYVAQGVHAEGPAGPPIWVEKYETPGGPVLITQSRAGRHTQSPSPSDGTEGPAIITVGGRLVHYFEDDWRTHATTQVAGVLVSVEALLPAEQTLGMVRYVQ